MILKARTLAPLVLLVIACQNRSASTPEPSQCKRSIARLEKISSKPTACKSDLDCESGSSCDASGHCHWDCLSDSDCGAGRQCSCQGLCIAGAVAALSFPPTCQKDRAALEDMDLSCATLPCPAGAYCEQQQARCVFDCLGDEDCTGGKRCDCEGKCSAPPVDGGAPPPSPVARNVVMEVRPLAYRLRPQRGAPVAPVAFEVTLTSPTASPGAIDLRFVPAEVRAAIPVADGGVGGAPAGDACVPPQVRCSPGAAFASDCHVTGPLAFVQDASGQYVAHATVEAQLAPTLVERTCGLELRSNETQNPLVTASVQLVPGDVVPVDGFYAGSITLDEVDGAPSAYPMQGVFTAGRLVLVDLGRVVSDHPALAIAPPHAARTVRWLRPTGGTPGTSALATLTPAAPAIDAATGRLIGTLQLAGPAGVQLTFHYELTRQATMPFVACGPGVGCADSALTCQGDVGRCLPKDDAVVAGADFLDPRRQAWTPQALAARPPYVSTLPSSRQVEALLCHDPAHPGDYLGTDFISIGSGPVSERTDAGELACAHSASSQAFPFLSVDQPFQTGSDGHDVFNLLASCVSELGQQPQSAQAFSAAHCLSPGRFFAALAQVGAPADALSNRLFEVLLRGWLRAHATIGRIASLERQNADALAQEGQASQTPPIDDLLDTLDRGWDLLLDAEVRARILALPGSDVADADYRGLRNPLLYWSFNQMPTPAATVAVPDRSGNGLALNITGTRSVWNGNASHLCTSYPTCRHPSFGLAGRQSQPAPDATVTGSLTTRLECEPREDFRKPRCHRFTEPTYDGGVTCSTRAQQAKAALPYSDGVTAVVTGVDRTVQSPTRFSETCHIRLDGVPVWNYGAGPVCGAPSSVPCETPSDATKDMLASTTGTPLVPVTCATAEHSRLTLEGDYTLFGEMFVVGTDAPAQYLLRKADGSFEVTVQRKTGDGGPNVDNIYVNIHAASGAVNYRITTQPGLYAFIHRDGVFRFYGTPPGAPYGDLVELAAVQSAGPRIPVGTSTSGRLELNCSRSVWLDDVVIFDRAIEAADLQRLKAAHQRSVDLPFPLAPLTDSQAAAYKVGLPVYVLEAAWRHLDLLEQSLGASAGNLYAGCIAGGAGDGRAAQLRRLGGSLRRILAAEGLAHSLAATVSLEAQPWAPRYRAAVAAVRAARSRLSFLARQIDRCDNPLGIAESDLPLYYQPAPGDAIASFFGSSRYLTHEAELQTQLAASRLEAARTAAMEQRNSRFQQKLNTAEHLRRVANLRQTAEAALEQLCGTPTGSPVGATPILDGVLTPSGIDYDRLRGCFLDTTRTACTTASLQDVPPDCVRGKLGEQVLALQGAQLSATSARNSWERAQTQYEEYGRRCYEKSERFANDQQALQSFLDEVEHWRGLKLAADIVATVARASNGCTSLTDVVFSFGASCAAAIVGGAAEIASLSFQEKINRVEADYQANKERRDHDELIRDCFFEADQQRHVIEAQLDVLKEAAHTILASQLELQNLRSQLEFEAVQAQSALTIESQLDVSIPQHHFWFDERINAYRYSLEWARRLTYLAMRSAEYESQTSLQLRGTILSAQRPTELDAVQRTLRALNVPGQVGTNRVDYIPLVVSLRDQILRMLPELDPATHAVKKTAVQVFQEYLASSGTVVYSHGRRYGRGIRFSMRPFSATTTSCAERLWRVSASIQMDAEPLLGQDVLVYQANTFGSQICGTDGRLQIARTRPERNLLMPSEDGSPTLVPLGGDPSATASMRVEALFNRTRRELLDLAPDTGNSGLAGRGLFSDYVLVIPDAAVRDGFDFTRMKDVLLRLQLVGTAAGGDIDP